MHETRKLAAILAADVVGYSRLASADEDRTLARLRALRSDLVDPTIDVHRGRVVKRTGDGILAEFRSVVDAVRCAIEVQNGMLERNAGVPAERRIEFRIGVHLGDVVEEDDGDLMGDGVNIAARLEGVARPGAIYLSEDAYRQVKARLDLGVSDLGATQLKNIFEPVRIFSLQVGAVQADGAAKAKSDAPKRRPVRALIAAGIATLLLACGAAFEGGRFASSVTVEGVRPMAVAATHALSPSDPPARAEPGGVAMAEAAASGQTPKLPYRTAMVSAFPSAETRFQILDADPPAPAPNRGDNSVDADARATPIAFAPHPVAGGARTCGRGEHSARLGCLARSQQPAPHGRAAPAVEPAKTPSARPFEQPAFDSSPRAVRIATRQLQTAAVAPATFDGSWRTAHLAMYPPQSAAVAPAETAPLRGAAPGPEDASWRAAHRSLSMYPQQSPAEASDITPTRAIEPSPGDASWRAAHRYLSMYPQQSSAAEEEGAAASRAVEPAPGDASWRTIHLSMYPAPQ